MSESEKISESQTYEVEMVHNKASAKITCSAEATYEDFIKLALERFSIPVEYARFIQISFQNRYTFDKSTFEYYLRLFPAPKIAFEIDVDYVALLDGMHESMLGSEGETSKPRRRQRRSHSRGSSRRRHSYFKKPMIPKSSRT